MLGIKIKGQTVALATRVSNLEGDPRRKVVIELDDEQSGEALLRWARAGGEGEVTVGDETGKELARFYLVVDGTVLMVGNGLRVPCSIRR